MPAEAYPDDLKYSAEHDWARIDDGEVVFGITWFAQDSLGEVVYVELPAEGSRVAQGEAFGEIESLKSVSKLYAPLSGTVEERNGLLDDEPSRVNADCYGGGWLVRVRLDDPSEIEHLMSAGEYRAHLDL